MARINVEIDLDASGNLRIANEAAVQLAILSGTTVVVQVCTTDLRRRDRRRMGLSPIQRTCP
ncbi:hypothetical protein EDD25_0316 [Cryobacterium psychrophilum]|nr:hypothetical protein EDD25_0316 [Cryobacterium psychrophilum]